MRTVDRHADSSMVKTANELPQPPPTPLPPLPHPIGANRSTPPPRSSSLAPDPPANAARPMHAPSTPSVQLGSQGFNQQRQQAKRAGIGVGVLLVAVFMFGIAFAVKQFEGTTTIDNLATGDCLANFFPSDENGESEVFLVKKISCDEPHAMEVYATTESAYFGLTTFPGQDEAFDIGQAECLRQWQSFTGVAPEESPYELWTLVPLARSWSQGDRTVQCLIGSYDEQTLVEGTLRNSGSGF